MTRGVIYGQQLHGACQTLARLPPCPTLTHPVPEGMEFEHPVWAIPSQKSESKLLVYFSSRLPVMGINRPFRGHRSLQTCSQPSTLWNSHSHKHMYAHALFSFSLPLTCPPSLHHNDCERLIFFHPSILSLAHAHAPHFLTTFRSWNLFFSYFLISLFLTSLSLFISFKCVLLQL